MFRDIHIGHNVTIISEKYFRLFSVPLIIEQKWFGTINLFHNNIETRTKTKKTKEFKLFNFLLKENFTYCTG